MLPLEVDWGRPAVTEEVTVVGRAADVLTQTAQVATNFKQELISTLPTNRDINAYLLLAPACIPPGRTALLDRRLDVVRKPVHGQRRDGQRKPARAGQRPYIEDAIQETTVATAGISAEYGRFSGGVVNVVTKSGGNIFSASFRETLHQRQMANADAVRGPSIAADPAHKELRVDKTVPTHEYTFGGPVLQDRLWFFTPGRIQTQTAGTHARRHEHPLYVQAAAKRYEGKGTYSVNPQPSRSRAHSRNHRRADEQHVQHDASMDVTACTRGRLRRISIVVNYSGVLEPNLFVEGASRAPLHASWASAPRPPISSTAR